MVRCLILSLYPYNRLGKFILSSSSLFMQFLTLLTWYLLSDHHKLNALYSINIAMILFGRVNDRCASAFCSQLRAITIHQAVGKRGDWVQQITCWSKGMALIPTMAKVFPLPRWDAWHTFMFIVLSLYGLSSCASGESLLLHVHMCLKTPILYASEWSKLRACISQ